MITDLADLQALADDAPFHRWLGVRVSHVGGDGIELEIDWHDAFSGHSQRGYVHGGVVSAAIDLAGYLAVAQAQAIPRATADLLVDFHRPIFAEGFRVRASAHEPTSSACCGEARVYRLDGKLAASGRGRYSLHGDERP